MSGMATSAAVRTNPPDDAALAQTLGKTKNVWDAIVDHIDRLPNGLVRKWKFYGTKYGLADESDRGSVPGTWSRTKAPSWAALALNDKAVAALRSQKIPPRLLREITTGKTYPEGRPARIEVTSRRDLAVVKKLLALKLGM